ncbi:hypothetical protein QZH41_009360, partial [Actinostola sp. cb2023]
ELLYPHNVYFSQNGHPVHLENKSTIFISDNDVLRVHYRLLGGKGGFGSMLRAIGAQIEKTTSREACRDLSGRRMRDVNDEKKITEWVAKQADKEREIAKQKQERLQRRRATPKHNFDDRTYTKQIQKNLERIDDALKQGFQASTSTTVASSSGIKRKGPAHDKIPKKHKMWMDITSEELDDSDEDMNIDPSPTNKPSTSTSTSTPSTSKLEQAESSSDDGNTNEETPLSKVTEKPALPHHSTETSEAQSSNLAEEKSPPELTVKNDADTTACTNEDNSKESKPFCIDDYKISSELESLGLDQLKKQLMALGLKCGGTLQERAQRLFSTKGKSLKDLDRSLFAKPSKGQKKLKKK